jgi:hypothetical protein
MSAIVCPEFDIIFSVPDLPPCVFAWLDASSLALAACVCRAWRDAARKARGTASAFRLTFREILRAPQTLIWAIENLGDRKLPEALRAIVCEAAAGIGDLELLRWARTNGYEWNEDSVCAEAAENGHLGIIQWVLETGTRSGRQLCANAAASGNLKIIQWARENGFAWDQRFCVYASQNGHLDVLQWLRANGCPWDRNECWIQAEYCGHKAVVAWIKIQSE